MNVSSGDLITSSQRGCPPSFEISKIFGKDATADGSEEEEEEPVLRGCNFSSSFLETTLEVFDHTGLHRAIRAATQATLALEDYCEVDNSMEALAELLDLRNKAQWLALRVRKAPWDPDTSVDEVSEENSRIYEIVRIAVLIYNNLVLYPLPPVSGVDTRLALSLKSELEIALEDQPSIWKLYPKLLLWGFMLGGISDNKDSEREWFKEHFRKLTTSTFAVFRQWSQIERCLTSYLWLDSVLNEEAIKFWEESCKA